MLTVAVGMPLRNTSGTCIRGSIALGVVEQPEIATPTATAIAAHIRDIGTLERMGPRIYTTRPILCSRPLGDPDIDPEACQSAHRRIGHEWVRRTDEQKNNNCFDPGLCRAFESKLKASLNYIL